MRRRRFMISSSSIGLGGIKDYLTIEALENGLTAKLSGNACEYCIDGGPWVTLSAGTTTPSINKGHYLSFKGNLTPSSGSGIGTFTVSKAFNLTGNCMSMLFGTESDSNKSLSGKNYAFSKLFQNCTTLKSVSDDFLPATTLSNYCYQYMFAGCSMLTKAPELPATTLASQCYSRMFYNCNGLTDMPELPATTLATQCYEYMFSGCSSLKNIHTLPATTLQSRCYQYMFYQCTSLTKAPELPATTLAIYCYYYMFYGCSGLTSAPELPAETLSSYCYQYMFNSCSNLNYIKMLAITTTTNHLSNWVSGVAASGIFVKNVNATWDRTGVSGVPTSWVVKYSAFKMDNYLTINAEENSLSVKFSNSCQYSIDGGDWVSLSANTLTPSINIGQNISFKANLTPNSTNGIGKFTVNKAFNLTGNCMSMLFGDNANTNKSLSGKNFAFYKLFQGCTTLKSISDNFLRATTLSSNCYAFMFYGCSGLTTPPKLPATTLTEACYYNMFNNCFSLTTAPELPATTATYRCYEYMFSGCESLTTPPKLPATTLAERCYSFMFYGCISLTSVPNLPATLLAPEYCYHSMFEGCESITSAPELPAKTLAEGCYYQMFKDCTSLMTAPSIKGTNLIEPLNITDDTSGCCQSMFEGCTSLTTASKLPATTLASECYMYMFQYCSSLTTAPELPATTLAVHCYHNMFYDCTSLTTAPELPATTLADYCYYGMFQGCESLTSAPELFADILVPGCYLNMFYGCSNLNYIKMLATDISAENCLISDDENDNRIEMNGWVTAVASSGTFVKNINATWAESWKESNYYNAYVVPKGWNVKTVLNLNDYLTIEVLEDNTYIERVDARYYIWQYLINGDIDDVNKEWSYFDNDDETPLLNAGDKISFKAYGFENPLNGIGNFSVKCKVYENNNFIETRDADFNLTGNCMSMAFGDNGNINKSLAGLPEIFHLLFKDCKRLKYVSKNLLPATTLSDSCYWGMFEGCESLISAPELPATTLVQDCYYEMFRNCTSLTTAPELPATTATYRCYMYMFAYCESLTKAPNVLPATTLAKACYSDMFLGCSSLRTAPELPATTLINSCYECMFQDCSHLNYIKMLARDIFDVNGYRCTSNWVNGVASSGTFIKNKSATWNETGVNGIPTGWTVQNNYNTPSIINTLTDDYNIHFYYDNGIYTPTSQNTVITSLTNTQLLSLRPNCNIGVTIYYPNIDTNRIYNNSYEWNTTKKLNDILYNNIYSDIPSHKIDNNINYIVKNIAIIITNVSTSGGNDGYYGGGTEAINNI